MAVHFVPINEHLEALDRLSETDVCVSVRRIDDNPHTSAAAVAQADNFGDRWWVSRVIVRERDARGQGLGSIAVQRMLAKIAEHSELPVYVCPGGYDDNTDQQFRFYLKNGFRPIADAPDTLIWTAPKPEV